MLEAVNKIKSLNLYKTGQDLINIDLIETQKVLQQNINTSMPEEFVKFLHFYNGFSFDGGQIFGVFNKDCLVNNIVIENNVVTLANKIILGKDEFDYIAYDYTTNKYQAIDINDLEILEEFNNFSDAFFYIIKI